MVVAVCYKASDSYFFLLPSATPTRNLTTKIKSLAQTKVSQDVNNKHFLFSLSWFHFEKVCNYAGAWTHRVAVGGWHFQQIFIIEELWGRQLHSAPLAYHPGGESRLSNKQAPYLTHNYHLCSVPLPSINIASNLLGRMAEPRQQNMTLPADQQPCHFIYAMIFFVCVCTCVCNFLPLLEKCISTSDACILFSRDTHCAASVLLPLLLPVHLSSNKGIRANQSADNNATLQRNKTDCSRRVCKRPKAQ